MLTIASTSEVLAAMQHAHQIVFSSYVLRRGSVLDALDGAAKRGASVTVRLEGRPVDTPDHQLATANAQAVDRLNADGAHAKLWNANDTRFDPRAIHLKAALIDGSTVFLDDRNWPDDGADTIVRDTNAADVAAVDHAIFGKRRPGDRVQTKKEDAVNDEAKLLQAFHGHSDVLVQSESFGPSRIACSLEKLLHQHVPVRLIVSQRALKEQERLVLDRLQHDGGQVRVGESDEKMAIVGDRGWIGSANATSGVPDQADWGIRITEPDILATMRRHFERNWEAATPLPIKEG